MRKKNLKRGYGHGYVLNLSQSGYSLRPVKEIQIQKIKQLAEVLTIITFWVIYIYITWILNSHCTIKYRFGLIISPQTVYACWIVSMSRPFNLTTDSTWPFSVWSSRNLNQKNIKKTQNVSSGKCRGNKNNCVPTISLTAPQSTIVLKEIISKKLRDQENAHWSCKIISRNQEFVSHITLQFQLFSWLLQPIDWVHWSW